MADGPRFSSELNDRIFEANHLAGVRGDTHSDIPHLLKALLSRESGEIVTALRRAGQDVQALRARVESALPPPPAQSGHRARRWADDESVQVTSGFMAVLDQAAELASTAGDYEVGEMHVIRAIDARGDKTSRLLEAIDLVVLNEPTSSSSVLERLAKFGRVLTDEARAGRLDPVIGRAKEMERLIHILGRRRKNNPVLLGEPGVGKTAIVEGLAQAIVEARVPSHLREREIFSLDVGSLVAGTKYRGEFESRIQELLETIRASGGRIVLFIDELHLIARAGGAEGAIDAAGFLKPLLARGELRAIGATTFSDFRQQFIGDGALERRFQPIPVREPTHDEAVEMLKGLRPTYERHHRISITDSAISFAVESSHSRIPYRNLPDKAIDLIDEAASRRRSLAESQGHDGSLVLNEDDVQAVLEAWTGEEDGDWAREIYGDLHDPKAEPSV
jgi:ATP-dependent Clp protease ATP-binding subunit ClpB